MILSPSPSHFLHPRFPFSLISFHSLSSSPSLHRPLSPHPLPPSSLHPHYHSPSFQLPPTPILRPSSHPLPPFSLLPLIPKRSPNIPHPLFSFLVFLSPPFLLFPTPLHSPPYTPSFHHPQPPFPPHPSPLFPLFYVVQHVENGELYSTLFKADIMNLSCCGLNSR